MHLEVTDDPDWFHANGQIGSVADLTTDTQNNLLIFHRGEKDYTEADFDESNRFLRVAEGPIRQTALLIIDQATGEVVHRWGSEMYAKNHFIVKFSHKMCLDACFSVALMYTSLG